MKTFVIDLPRFEPNALLVLSSLQGFSGGELSRPPRVMQPAKVRGCATGAAFTGRYVYGCVAKITFSYYTSRTFSQAVCMCLSNQVIIS